MSDENNEIENLFEAACTEHQPVIKEKLAEINKLIADLEKYAELHGVAFGSADLDLGVSYIPESIQEKFPGITSNQIRKIAKAAVYNDEWNEFPVQWQSSAGSC